MANIRVESAGHAAQYDVTLAHGQVLLDGKALVAALEREGTHQFTVNADGQQYDVVLLGVDETGLKLRLSINGKRCEVTLTDPAARYKSLIGLDKRTNRAAADLRAPMPGLVRKLHVAPGQAIKKGDPLVTLEAMKMENILKAAADATVAGLGTTEGAAVEKGAVLVKFA